MVKPKINADSLFTIDLIKFNNFISVIKALKVDSVDIIDSVLTYESDNMLIESDLKEFFRIDVNGNFPLNDKGLNELTSVILSEKGSVHVMEDSNENIVIKKEFSDNEYRLGAQKFHPISSAIKNAIPVSDVLQANEEDRKHFQDLLKAKETFVLQDGKQFCIVGKDKTILDKGCASNYQKSYAVEKFISYMADDAKFQVKDNAGEFWLHATYTQNGIPVNVYLKLEDKPYSKKSKKQNTINAQGLTQIGYITPNNFDILYKVLKFFKSFKSVSIFQGEAYAIGKVLAYADISDLFSNKVSFKIPEPTKFQKNYSGLDDNAGSSVRYDLKARNDILIAENQNKIVLIHVPPGEKIKSNLTDYLAADYAFIEFDKISNRPKQFDNVDTTITVNGERIDKNYRLNILSPVYFELTKKKFQEFCNGDPIQFPVDDNGKPIDGLVKPPADEFFRDIIESIKGVVGIIYADSDQFNQAFDNATRNLINAIEPDENLESIHVRKRDLKIREKREYRFPIITQKDIDRYRTLITSFAKEGEKNSISQIYVKGNDLNLCNIKGKADHFHYFGDHKWDSLYEPKHFLSFEDNWCEFTIDYRDDDWLVTKHQFKQKDILTFEKIVKKVEQKNRKVVLIDPKCIVPTIQPLKPIDVIEQEIISDYKQYLDYRFKMLKNFCHILKNKQFYFKDQKEMTTFFDELREKLKIAQSTMYGDRRIAEMLISLGRDNILKNYQKGWSYKLLRIASAYDDKTKDELLDKIDTLKRHEVDKFVAESKPQFIKDKPKNSKIKGMKIRKDNTRIILSFEKRGTETDEDVAKKLQKIYKMISKLEKID
jgi:hypothetical protein